MSDEYKMNSLFNDVVMIDGSIYYYSAQLGFLRKSSIEKGDIDTLYVPKDIFIVDRMVNIGKTIYAFDVFAKNMLVYDIDSRSFFREEINCGDAGWGNFVDVFARDEQIYIVSKSRNCIYKYDTHSKSISELEYPCSSREKVGVVAGDEYFLFVDNGKEIVRVDLNSFGCKVMSGHREDKVLRHCYYYDGCIYLLCAMGEIFRYDNNTGLFFDCYESNMNQEYIRLIVTENYYFALPSHATGDILRIRKGEKEGEIIHDYPADYSIIKSDWSMYTGYCESDDIVIFSRRASNYCLMIDKKSENIQWKALAIIPDEKEKALNLQRYMFHGDSDIVRESSRGTLKDYLNAMRISEVAIW